MYLKYLIQISKYSNQIVKKREIIWLRNQNQFTFKSNSTSFIKYALHSITKYKTIIISYVSYVEDFLMKVLKSYIWSVYQCTVNLNSVTENMNVLMKDIEKYKIK